ncbi:MAG: prephenate dehydrogenase [Lachnospiraceae bacterium]|nr:prephenate dehydrogenase [Lachnospiraceae bacterium]
MSKYGFVGLGLIGGSLARALKNHDESNVIVAYNRSPEPLEQAVSDGVVDIALHEIGEGLSDCDVIFLCLPVVTNAQALSTLSPYVGDKTIVTDVSSVKCSIMKAADEAGLREHFVGGHPMAGSERTGYIASSKDLYRNAYYIITPFEEGDPKAEVLKKLSEDIGAIPIVMDAEKHDRIVAGVSHIPHLAAAALVELVKNNDYSDGLMKVVAAGGFKDITRVASSSPAMWKEICESNDVNISAFLGDLIDRLSEIRKNVSEGNGEYIADLFDDAGTYRNSFNTLSAGPIKDSHKFSVDISDEPGAIASVATILAVSGINIKNIGIQHNREYIGGDMTVGFWDGESRAKAAEILKNKGYILHGV